MSRVRSFWFLVFVVALSLGLAPFGLAMAGTAGAGTSPRQLEPVILRGEQLAAFAAAPVDDLFAYVYRDGAWSQIPMQVDERDAEGAYTAAEDARFDANDELALRVQDLGAQAAGGSSPDVGSPVFLRGWYEVEVTDPVSPTALGWVYLVRSAALSDTFTDDYVSFDAITHRLSSDSYQLGFATPKQYVDYLTLGGSTTDLLDRTKIRVYCGIPIVCPLKEEALPNAQDALVRDGPIRVILRDGRILAYGSMLAWDTTLTIPQNLAGDIRLSTDFSPEASGATLYTAAVPDGVSVDGTPDSVPATPVSPWWQLSHETGSVVQVTALDVISGTVSSFYEDDATEERQDTGDRLRYGETGFTIANPGTSLTYRFAIYFLPPSQPNLGTEYASAFAQPLSVAATYQEQDVEEVYLPLVRK